MLALKNLCFSSWEVVGLSTGSFCRHCLTMSCSSCNKAGRVKPVH